MAESRSNQLGPYQILDQIAQGAYGEVLRARHVGPAGFQRILAIKRLRPHVLADASAVRAFENEARIGGLLLHHNIAQTLEFRQDEGLYYLVMEYVDGVSFQELVLNHRQLGRPIPTEVVVELIGQACDGLHHAHEALGPDGQPLKLIHRDIKPSNLMLTRTGVVKVMDFGIARVDNQNLTDAGFIKGTPRYLSPEMITRNTVLDRRSDLFSLAAVFYELLALKPLFDAPNLLNLMARVRDADVGAQLRELGAVRPAFARLLARCLTPSPSARFQSARELGREVRQLKRELNLEDPDLEGYALEHLGLVAARSVRKTVQANGPVLSQLGGHTGQSLAGTAFESPGDLERAGAGPHSGLGAGGHTVTAGPVSTSALLAHVEARAGLAESRELSKAGLPPSKGPVVGGEIRSLLGPEPLTPEMLGIASGRPAPPASAPALPGQATAPLPSSARPSSGDVSFQAAGQSGGGTRASGGPSQGPAASSSAPSPQNAAAARSALPTVQLLRSSSPGVQGGGVEHSQGAGGPSGSQREAGPNQVSQPLNAPLFGPLPGSNAGGAGPLGGHPAGTAPFVSAPLVSIPPGTVTPGTVPPGTVTPGTVPPGTVPPASVAAAGGPSGTAAAGSWSPRPPGGAPVRPGAHLPAQAPVGASSPVRPAPPVDDDDDDSVQTITGRDISPYRGAPPAAAPGVGSSARVEPPSVGPGERDRSLPAAVVRAETPVFAPPPPPLAQSPVQQDSEDELQVDEEASPDPLGHTDFSADDWGDDEKSRVMTMEELERLKAGTSEADPSEAMLRTLSDVPLPGGGFSVRGAPPAPAREPSAGTGPGLLTRAPGAPLSWRAGMSVRASEAPDTTEPSITERFGTVGGASSKPQEAVVQRTDAKGPPVPDATPLFGPPTPRVSRSGGAPVPESDLSGTSSSTIRLPPPVVISSTEPDVQQRTRLVSVPPQPFGNSAGPSMPELPPALPARDVEQAVETKLFVVSEGQERSAPPLGVRSTTLVSGPTEQEEAPAPERPKGETPFSRLLRPGAILVHPDQKEGGSTIHPIVVLGLGLVVVSFILYLLSQL